MLDMSIQVLIKVVEDMAVGRLVPLEVGEDGAQHVDFNQYVERVRKSMESDQQRVERAQAAGSSPLAAPTEEEVVMFGGTGGAP